MYLIYSATCDKVYHVTTKIYGFLILFQLQLPPPLKLTNIIQLKYCSKESHTYTTVQSETQCDKSLTDISLILVIHCMDISFVQFNISSKFILYLDCNCRIKYCPLLQLFPMIKSEDGIKCRSDFFWSAWWGFFV